MKETPQIHTSRSVLRYIVIAAALVIALLLGIRWMKTQSSTSSGQQTPVVVQNQPHEESKAVSTDNDSVASEEQASENVISSGAASPARVPSTGASDVVLSTVSLGILIFAVSRYITTRRRLLELT